MGVATPHALGRNQKFFAKAETTFGTAVVPAATNAMKVLKSAFKWNQKRDDRMDSRASASTLERITGRKEASWSMECYAVPSGSAGTAPDIGDILKALFGTETTSGGVSVTYSLSASQSVRGSLTLVREYSSVFSQIMAGAFPHTMNLKLSGGDQPKFSFEGRAADCYYTGYTTTNGALSGGETSVVVTDGSVYEAGSLITIGSSTGHTVTAVSTNTLTVSPAVSGAQSSGVAVIPYVPSETVAGVPIAGVLGSFTIDGSAAPITGFELNVKTNDAPFEDEAFTALLTDYIPGFREVTGSISIRIRRDQFKYISAAKLFATRDLAVTCGNVAGKRLVVNVDYAEFEFGDIEMPEAEVGTCTIPFKALGSSGEDEVNLVWN